MASEKAKKNMGVFKENIALKFIMSWSQSTKEQ